MNTPPNLYDHVLACLRAKVIPQREVARASGVPFSTVAKIAQGSVTDPSVHTVQKLFDYFVRTLPGGPTGGGTCVEPDEESAQPPSTARPLSASTQGANSVSPSCDPGSIGDQARIAGGGEGGGLRTVAKQGA